ncbi:MAG: hypothetical protein F6K54_29845 [Okeania sp. SIO3B5]|uniref:hypothetical protein n=1 Tax=Okeania sp. SIO3B5 TaxID=2607811 RepID=UPI0013FFA37A|nr:hypothetical protein [Okeania sp. SIO3B5]NEO56907.1 hypothetical protein [Okeania sp. SIO3B5]
MPYTGNQPPESQIRKNLVMETLMELQSIYLTEVGRETFICFVLAERTYSIPIREIKEVEKSDSYIYIRFSKYGLDTTGLYAGLSYLKENFNSSNNLLCLSLGAPAGQRLKQLFFPSDSAQENHRHICQ